MSSNKKIILIVSLCSFPVIFLIVGRFLKFYILYTVPTTGMQPSINPHQIIFASSLLTPKRNNVVSYNATKSLLPNEVAADLKEIVGRIVAIESDTLEIKNGLLYLNNKMVDDTMNLSYNYMMSKESANRFPQKTTFSYSEDSVIINISPKELLLFEFPKDKAPPRIVNCDSEYIHPELVYCSADLKWSPDNFGPIIIPKDHFFIMGDNRSNSADSRYRGFVDKSDIIAVIVNH